MSFLVRLYWRFRHRRACTPPFTLVRRELLHCKAYQYDGWFIRSELYDYRFRCPKCGRLHHGLQVSETAEAGTFGED